MRLHISAVLLLCLLASGVATAATVNQFDIESGAQSNTVAFTHMWWLDINVPPSGEGPTDVVIDYLYPTSDLAEWGSFQTQTLPPQLTISFPELNPTVEFFSDQWIRLWWEIPAGFNWNGTKRFWIQRTFSGTRTQHASGVTEDLTASAGAAYTNPTPSVTAPQTVLDFATHCEANTVSQQVNGHYGTVQRVQCYLYHFYPGNCTSMSMKIAAAMRHINVPAAIAIGYIVPGTFSMPYGFGQYETYTYSFTPTIGHCWVGGWRDDSFFTPFDTNNYFSQLIALQACMIGYFEDPVDAQYSATLFGGSDYTTSSGYQYSNASSNGSQTYTWRNTRTLNESTWGNNTTYGIYAQKVASSYKGGSGIIDPPPTTGVGEDDPKGIPTPLAIFPASLRPVHSGEQLYVEIGAPETGVDATLRLFDVQGRMIHGFGFEKHLSGYSTESMNVPDSLGSGVYFAMLTFDGHKVDSDRIVVLR